LCLVGFIQACFRAILYQLPDIVIQGTGGLLEGLANHGLLAKVSEHADTLRTLPRKKKRGLAHQKNSAVKFIRWSSARRYRSTQAHCAVLHAAPPVMPRGSPAHRHHRGFSPPRRSSRQGWHHYSAAG